MKILYVTTIGATMGFFPEHIKMLQQEGHSVELAADFSQPVNGGTAKLGCTLHHIPFSRTVYSKDNICALFAMKRLLQCGQYDMIHTHTPNASAIVRFLARKYRKKGLKVIYTAHGFHFYSGAPLKNWLLYYPVEKFLSRWTDCLITINREDYKRAKKKFHAKKTVYIPGVGVDTEKFRPGANGREKIREELGLPKDRIMLLSVGELNENKNHESVIRAISGFENLTYVIVGKGESGDSLRKAASENGVDLRLSGFRNDVAGFYDAADIYILPSIREGLNVSLMEAMASSLACLAGKIRGNVDLIDENRGGYLFRPESVGGIREAVEKAVSMSPDKRSAMGRYNLQKIRKFDLQTVENMVSEIYRGGV